MTSRLTNLFIIPIAFLLVALALITAQQAVTKMAWNAPAIVFITDDSSQEVQLLISDNPEEYPVNDCGRNVTLRSVGYLSNDKTDPCLVGSMSFSVFVQRINEWMRRNGNKVIEFPNGVTREAVRHLAATNQLFVAGARAVLLEFAKAHGFDGGLPTFLEDFPFDAFLREF